MNRVQLIQYKTGEKITLEEGANVIGRDPDCDVRIDHHQLSRKHCRIECRGNTAIVRDLDSTNGTFVNGKPATRVVCDPGDELKLGNLRFLVKNVTVDDKPNLPSSGAEQSDDLLAGLDLEQLESAAPPAVKPSKKKRGKRRKPDAADVLAELNAEAEQVATPAPVNVEPTAPAHAQHSTGPATDPVAEIPASVQAAANVTPSTAHTPPAFTPPPRAAVEKPKRAREPMDWSFLKTFLEERTGLALALGVCLLLGSAILIPWSSLTRSSDATILEFYETALNDVKTSTASKSDLKAQSDAYVEELSDGTQLSLAGRQLLLAGRDYFPDILNGTATDDSSAETLFRERIGAARELVEGLLPAMPASQIENMKALEATGMMGEASAPEGSGKSS